MQEDSYRSTFKEDHLASEHFGERIIVQGSGGNRLGDFVTVEISGLKPGKPFWVLEQCRLGDIEVLLLRDVFGVLVNVDSEVRGDQVHLHQDASQVANLGCHGAFEVPEVINELEEVILIRIQEAGVSLVSPE